MKKLYAVVSLCSFFWGYSQINLNSPETKSRTVTDPVSITLSQGFRAASSEVEFTARIQDSNPSNPPSSGGGGVSPVNPSTPGGTLGSNLFHDTQGNIEVNGAGQLQFTLPIALPPGVKSVAPQVNLVYTSGSGNGIAGYGWNLSGITSIARVGKNIDKDGKAEGISLTYNDYYSFNGQRLILKSGEYGKDGSEYVTEKFSNVKIKAKGNLSGKAWKGPEYWEITFEDGSQAWYGNAAESRTPIEYNITKWKDAQGNYIVYHYTQFENASVISSIEWGGNEALGKPHFNKMIFQYAERDLKESSFVTGEKFVQNKILTSVQVNTSGKQFKKYVINYHNGENGTKYQFVNNITEYNSNNEPSNPVTFEYERKSQEKETSTYEYAVKNTHTKKYGDFDFDGVTDFLEMDTDGNLFFKKSVYINTPEIPLSYDKDDLIKRFFDKAVIIRYKKNDIINQQMAGIVIPISKPNSQGKHDYEFKIYAVNLKTKTLDYQYSKVLKFNDFKEPLVDDEQSRDIYKIYDTHIHNIIPYDYDGDGISELIINFIGTKFIPYDPFSNERSETRSNIKRYSLNNNTEILFNQTQEDVTLNEEIPFKLSEEEGDYTSSMLFDLKEDVPYEKSYYKFYKEHKDGFYVREWEVSDFNGDGIDELYYFEKNTLNYYNFDKDKNNGFLLFAKEPKILDGIISERLVGDFNGDGKIDFAIPQYNKSSAWNFYISNGVSFEKKVMDNFTYFNSELEISDEGSHRNFPIEKACYYGTYTKYSYRSVDLNGDGKSEIVRTKIVARNHTWNSHSDREYSQIYLDVFSLKDIETSKPNFKLEKSYSSHFAQKIIYFSPLFINRDNHQIILVGRPEDCPSENCDKNYVIHLNYPDFHKNTRIKSITQGGLRTEVDYKELDPVSTKDPHFYAPVKQEKYPYVELEKVSQSYAVSQLRQIISPSQTRKQDFRYRGFVTHLQGKGMIGFRKTARSSWYADGFENTKVWSGAEIDPLNEGLPIKEWSIKTNDETQIFPKDVSPNN